MLHTAPGSLTLVASPQSGWQVLQPGTHLCSSVTIQQVPGPMLEACRDCTNAVPCSPMRKCMASRVAFLSAASSHPCSSCSRMPTTGALVIVALLSGRMFRPWRPRMLAAAGPCCAMLAHASWTSDSRTVRVSGNMSSASPAAAQNPARPESPPGCAPLYAWREGMGRQEIFPKNFPQPIGWAGEVSHADATGDYMGEEKYTH